MKELVVAGIDLAGSSLKKTGIAIVSSGKLVLVTSLRKDDEIVRLVVNRKARIVAIDSPLTAPGLRGFRDVDKALIQMGYRVLPLGLRGMRMLVERAWFLKKVFEEHGLEVIETHPRSAVLNTGYSDPYLVIKRFIDTGSIRLELLTQDEIDAVIAAIVAWLYSMDKAYKVARRDGTIYLLPRIVK